MRVERVDILTKVSNSKIIKIYPNEVEASDDGALSNKAMYNINEYYLHTIGIGATFEKNIRLVELENGKRVWWADIVDNEFEEKVADWIFDEEGNTLLCYPDPSEFDNILEKIDESHGWNKWHEPPPKIKINAIKIKR
ncbi:MAG: hypothetical protein ACE5KT_08570 [Methanosarcinales archaeon]